MTDYDRLSDYSVNGRIAATGKISGAQATTAGEAVMTGSDIKVPVTLLPVGMTADTVMAGDDVRLITLQNGLANESTTRADADAQLQQNINSEADTRAQADNAMSAEIVLRAYDSQVFHVSGREFNWSAATAYAAGALCIRNGTIYLSLSDSNTGHDPAEAGSAYWTEPVSAVGPFAAVKAFTMTGDGSTKTWTFAHGLGRLPAAVTVLDDAHEEVLTEVSQTTTDVVVSINTALADGVAYTVKVIG